MIRLQNVTKTYRTNGMRKIVLDDISLDIDTRHAYGIMGLNGAGKSTLIRLIGGTDEPDRGRILRGCSISWPLAFSGGFHAKMTGRENINFVANIYGVDQRYVVDYVADFSELGAYLDAPVSTYSSGMHGRLGFALSMAIEFDFYLLDETTAAGDRRFVARCNEALAARRSRSGLMLVSHNSGTIKKWCDRGAILRNGRLTLYDDLDEAIETYKRYVG